jgi:hypothetical protein
VRQKLEVWVLEPSQRTTAQKLHTKKTTNRDVSNNKEAHGLCSVPTR